MTLICEPALALKNGWSMNVVGIAKNNTSTSQVWGESIRKAAEVAHMELYQIYLYLLPLNPLKRKKKVKNALTNAFLGGFYLLKDWTINEWVTFQAYISIGELCIWLIALCFFLFSWYYVWFLEWFMESCFPVSPKYYLLGTIIACESRVTNEVH